VKGGILPPGKDAMFPCTILFDEVSKNERRVPPGWKPRLHVRPEARRYSGKPAPCFYGELQPTQPARQAPTPVGGDRREPLQKATGATEPLAFVLTGFTQTSAIHAAMMNAELMRIHFRRTLAEWQQDVSCNQDWPL
jgi:hypothetical protein